jgi:hypothetical protein
LDNSAERRRVVGATLGMMCRRQNPGETDDPQRSVFGQN